MSSPWSPTLIHQRISIPKPKGLRQLCGNVPDFPLRIFERHKNENKTYIKPDRTEHIQRERALLPTDKGHQCRRAGFASLRLAFVPTMQRNATCALLSLQSRETKAFSRYVRLRFCPGMVNMLLWSLFARDNCITEEGFVGGWCVLDYLWDS